jgi:hypothetical protein
VAEPPPRAISARGECVRVATQQPFAARGRHVARRL